MLALIDYASKISIFCNQHYSIFSRVLLEIMPVCEFKTVLRFPTVSFSKKKTQKNPNFILIVSKARDILYFELRTCSNQTYQTLGWDFANNGTIFKSFYGHCHCWQLWGSFVIRTKVWKNRRVSDFRARDSKTSLMTWMWQNLSFSGWA